MKRSLNLIPMKSLRRQEIRRVFRQWLVLSAITVVGVSAVAWWTWNQSNDKQRLLQAAQQQYAPLKKLEEETESLRNESISLEQRERLALELSQKRSMLTLLGQLSFATKRAGGDVNINQMEMETEARPAQTDEEMATMESKLTLRGVGVDDVAIARFVAQLRDSQLFYDVHLTSTGSNKVGDIESKLYTVECAF